MSIHGNANWDLEREKIKLERERLKVERFKAWWTGISILIPLFVAAITLVFSAWSQAQQAQSEFEIKAAEIVLDTDRPSATQNKARALAALFPDRLPPDFAESFEPDLYSGPSAEAKKELLQLIVEHIDEKQEIVEMWRRLFPGDEWVNDLLE